MNSKTENNKRIAKNTLLLYFRMLLMMVVTLYTSRVVLNSLGVEDYGIYNVVGGVVSMFAILTASLSASISRFITYELGKGDLEKLKNIFSSAILILLGICLVVIILAETIGLWFLNTKMIIPEIRINAANWVYQLSILTFIINLISVPFNACIIAHEKMSVFAYVSLLEALCKLIVAYLITISSIDKLIIYAVLMCVIALVIRIVYGGYCKKHFDECVYRFTLDKGLFINMFGFAGWNFIGSSSTILREQGGNIMINLFCGPVVNAARGISVQVNTAISSFVQNFMTALNPQITKSYATGDKKYMMFLICQGSRLSFYMLLLLSLPIVVNTHHILQIWLGIVPDHTILFVKLTLILAMSESLSNPLVTAMLATGKIRNYQILVGGINMLNLPVSYFFLLFGFTPEIIVIVAIFFSQCCLAARLYMLRSMIGLDVKLFITKVYINVILVFIGTVVLFFLSKLYLYNDDSLLLNCFICIVSIVTSIFLIGCNKKERVFIFKKITKLRNKLLR